jgi:predicted dinucleotide-binding enzyme
VNIGIIGSGRIGRTAARLFARAGHDVLISFSRDPARLASLANTLGVRSGTPRDAATFGDPVVMLTVPWTLIDTALEQAGPLDGKVVIDTTNHFGPRGVEKLPEGRTAAQVNAARLPRARLVKAFNTLTAGFQAEAANRVGDSKVVIFYCGDDGDAKAMVARIIEEMGFVPVEVGGLSEATPMEAPRRPGAVYGEEYRLADAEAYLNAIRRGQPPPPLPNYYG